MPAKLNWDLWLGPRSARPYSSRLAPFVWRWVWDFGNGTMPDMSPHHFDPAFNALALDAPDTVEARTSFIDPQAAVGSSFMTYRYRARGDRGPLTPEGRQRAGGAAVHRGRYRKGWELPV